MDLMFKMSSSKVSILISFDVAEDSSLISLWEWSWILILAQILVHEVHFFGYLNRSQAAPGVHDCTKSYFRDSQNYVEKPKN